MYELDIAVACEAVFHLQVLLLDDRDLTEALVEVLQRAEERLVQVHAL